MNDDTNPTVQVFQSDRMSDPTDPSDTMHGKRFRGASGEPMSIIDILKSHGVIGEPEGGREDQSGGRRDDEGGVRGDSQG